MYESFKENKEIKQMGDALSLLPYDFVNGSAIEYDGRLHLLGGNDLGNAEDFKHYSWDGSTWVNESTLPYSVKGQRVAVYGGKLHLLGGSVSADYKKHYSWNGTLWVSESTLPVNFNVSSGTVVYNDEIHIINATAQHHYSWDGSAWNKASSPSFKASGVFCTYVYNGYICVCCGNSTTLTSSGYRWNGSSWSDYSTDTPNVKNYNCNIIVFKGVPYTVGTTSYRLICNLSTGHDANLLPCVLSGQRSCVYDDCLYWIGGMDTTLSLLNISLLDGFDSLS